MAEDGQTKIAREFIASGEQNSRNPPKTCIRQKLGAKESKHGLQYSESVAERTFKQPRLTSI